MELLSVRSLLFVPASKLEKMPKMRESGADLLIIDTEDSIAPDQKDDMRRELTRFFHKTPDDSAASLIGVRINALRTFNGLLDVMTVFGFAHMPDVLILPKVEHVAELEIITGWFEQIGETLPVIVLAENLEIWDNIDPIAAHPAVAGIMLGGIDLAAELGCDTSWEAMSPYRAMVVRAARRHHKLSLDMPWFDLSDIEGLRRETLRSKSFGFDARAAIHPGQVPIIQACFTPTPEELTEAQTIIDLFESSGNALATYNGKVIELPVVKKCYRLLMRAPQTND